MTPLIFEKCAAVLTVMYAGLNLHQLTYSYAHLLSQLDEFKEGVAQSGGAPRLAGLNFLFYLALPAGYLIMLGLASLPAIFLAAVAVKFLVTAALGMWTENRVLTGPGYNLLEHRLGRLDNLLNLAASVGIVYLILRGGPLD